jgi:hypothetical protein
MQLIKEQEWQSLPESAQQEVYDFFVFIKQRQVKVADTPSVSLNDANKKPRKFGQHCGLVEMSEDFYNYEGCK